MNTSYRNGFLAVLLTVFVSLAICLVGVSAQPQPERAAHQLNKANLSIGPFRLTERSGREITDADLVDRVWISSFIFTRCALSCPRISSVMKGLQEQLASSGVQLVSLSVDPDYDTPAVLAEYARRFNADPNRWWFLTGPKAEVYDLISERFKLTVQPISEAEQQNGAESVMHSERLALVDRGGKLVGMFDSTDKDALTTLIQRARDLDSGGPPAWARRLPEVNASLNALCACLLMAGWFAIRRRNIRGHLVSMITAVVVAALFLVCYLIYHYHVGSVRFQGVGLTRLIYFTVLLSHTVLATFGVVPLVAFTLTFAAKQRFERHARVARLTFPIWMYVSVTGVVIYLMLYQLPVANV